MKDRRRGEENVDERNAEIALLWVHAHMEAGENTVAMGNSELTCVMQIAL